MNMIEKVARAMYISDNPENDWDSRYMSDYARNAWCVYAKAAIEAMREPSDGMLKSVQYEAMLFNNDVDMERTYTKMIDAALKEE